MRKDPMRLDANESAFFTRQLEYVKSRTYDTQYQELKATQLLPVSTEAPMGANEITWRSYTGIGQAKIIADYAKDFPRVDVYGTENTVKLKDIGDAYGYSLKEIRQSQYAGARLDQRRASMARRAIDEKIDGIAWNGDDDYNIQGFIDYPGINEYTVPDDADADGPEWIYKTPDEIIADLSGIVSTIIEATNGKETPDTILLPIAQYLLIANTRMTDGNDKTILKYFMENNPFITRIEWVTELDGAGASGADRMMCYKNASDKLTLEIPNPFEQFAPQQQGLEYEIPCLATTGGVIVYYPLSIAYGDGI